MEGVMRILRELVIEDNISRNQIVNHINYLIQIACFAQTKRWSSVVAYDAIYRREQHTHGFAWGRQSAFMASTLLPKDPPPNKDNRDHRHRAHFGDHRHRAHFGSNVNPHSNNFICGRWNGKSGCNGVNCTYDHVCKQCFANHPVTQHTQKKNT